MSMPKLSKVDMTFNWFMHAVYNSKYVDSIPSCFLDYLLEIRIKRGERRLAGKQSPFLMPCCIFIFYIICMVSLAIGGSY